MHAWRIAVLVVGALWFTAAGAQAQTQTGSAPTAPAPAASASAADGGQRVLTPEQIEELQAMVGRMQSAMQDMVASARSTAGRLAEGGQTVVVSTTEIAAIALGAAGGAILIDLLGGGGLATVAGAVVGGVAAHWIITYPPVAKSVGES
jgi:phage-related tail protein